MKAQHSAFSTQHSARRTSLCSSEIIAGHVTFFIFLFVLILNTLTWGQTARDTGTFKITQTNPVISTSTISGNQSYKLSHDSRGFTIKSNLWVAEGETPVLSEITEEFAPDWTLKHYTFNGLVGGIQQKIETWIEGDKVHMQFSAERANPQRIVELCPNTVVLDNFVPTNFQALLNRYAAISGGGSGKAQDFYLLVPQKLMALKGTLARTGSDEAMVNGKKIQAAKYILRMFDGVAQIWADEHNQVLGVYFDAADIEYLRAGVGLPQLNAAMARTRPRETLVSFLSDGLHLLGTLMLPPENLKKKSPYPLVVIAGGFGPVDRDGTVARNKPLRDIAVGLAHQGIASLRYDKVTHSLYDKLDPSHLTIQTEAIDPAVAAVAYARTVPQVDSTNIFLLGYSEGAELAPFILQKATEVRGVVMMAAPARPPDQFVPEQLAAGLRMKGTPQAEIDAQVAQLKKQFEQIRQNAMPDSSIVLGYSAHFWRSLLAQDVLSALREMTRPVLLLQGGRDMQLSQQDYQLIRSAVPAGKLDSEYFTELNHIFTNSPEGSSGSEISIGAHVSAQVISRIGDWMEKQISASALARQRQIPAMPELTTE